MANTAADDYGNDSSTNGVLAAGGQITGNIELPNDKDWFKVTLNAGQTYVFDLLGFDGGGGTLGANAGIASLFLFDANGSVLDSAIDNGVNGDPRLSYTAKSSGAYYLQAFDLLNGTGTYTLKAAAAGANADDFGASAATAGTLAVGGHITGNIELPNDKDWFKVTLNAGQTYVFDLLGADGGGGTLGAGAGEASLFLFDGNGSVLDSAIDNGVNGDPRLSYTAKSSGAYYLQAFDLLNGTGTYTLKAAAAGANADDFGASAATAGTLAVGGHITGNIELANDKDWFKVTLNAGQTYVFDLLGADGGGGTLGAGAGEASLFLFDANGSVLDSAIDNGVNGDPRMSYSSKASGAVYLQVFDLLNGTGTYTVKAWNAGSAAGDRLVNTPANDILDGGAGIDTMQYTGKRADFTVARTGSQIAVTDKTGAAGADVLTNVERIAFADTTLAFDINGAAGKAYRVYQAAFDRTPDSAGLGYWIGALDSGASLDSVASSFVASKEFQDLYGAHPSNAALVSRFYENVLHRPAEKAGYDYWLGVLDSGASVGAVLASFSESAENQAALATVIGNGFAYTPYG